MNGSSEQKVKNQRYNECDCHGAHKSCSRILPRVGRKVSKRFMRIKRCGDRILPILTTRRVPVRDRNTARSQQIKNRATRLGHRSLKGCERLTISYQHKVRNRATLDRLLDEGQVGLKRSIKRLEQYGGLRNPLQLGDRRGIKPLPFVLKCTEESYDG